MFIPLIALNGIIFLSILNYFFNISDSEVKIKKIFMENRVTFLVVFFVPNTYVLMLDVCLDLIFLLLFFLLSTLFIMSIIDVKTKLISDNINIFAFIVGMFYAYIGLDLEVFVENLTYSFLVIGIFTFIRFVFSIVLGREIIGEGDFIPLSMFVLLFGIKLGILLLLFSFLLTVPFFMTMGLFRRFGMSELPFIPFISLGLGLGLLFDEKFLVFCENIFNVLF